MKNKINICVIILVVLSFSQYLISKSYLIPFNNENLSTIGLGYDFKKIDNNYIIASQIPDIEFQSNNPLFIYLDSNFNQVWLSTQIFKRPVITKSIKFNSENNIEYFGYWIRGFENDYRPFKMVLNKNGKILSNFYDSIIVKDYITNFEGGYFIENNEYIFIRSSLAFGKNKIFTETYDENFNMIKYKSIDTTLFNERTSVNFIIQNVIVNKQNEKFMLAHYTNGNRYFFSNVFKLDDNYKIIDTIIRNETEFSTDFTSEIERKYEKFYYDEEHEELSIIEFQNYKFYNTNQFDTTIYLTKYNLDGKILVKKDFPRYLKYNDLLGIKKLKNNKFILINRNKDSKVSKNEYYQFHLLDNDFNILETINISNEDYNIYMNFRNDNQGFIETEDGIKVFGVIQSNNNFLYFEEIKFLTMSINDNSNSNSLIFPNPSSDNISLDLGGVEFADLVIYDILGNEIMSIPNYSNKSEIDISTLSIGTYTIQVQTSTGSISQRLLVNR